MSQPTLTLSSIGGLLNTRGLYLVGYSWLCGMSIWVTFFGGVIAHRVLPRQQFGTLQLRTFPVYFTVTLALGSGLLATWLYDHPHVLAQIDKPSVVDVAQAYALAMVIFFQGANHFIIGPLTSKTMVQRHKLEKDEGKAYDDVTVSQEMKALNSRFGILHALSSLANLGAVIVLIFHGFCLGNVQV